MGGNRNTEWVRNKCCYLGYNWKGRQRPKQSQARKVRKRQSESFKRINLKVPYQQWFVCSEYSSCVQ